MKDSLYSIGDIIGKGSYGSVHSGVNLVTNTQVALKFIEKSALKKPSHFERLRREVRILRLIKDQSPYIVSLEAVHETSTHAILVMENLKGGELITLIKQGLLREEYIARECFSQLISAVLTLHNHGIIHRDIKPQNILLLEPNTLTSPSLREKITIKLVDFGFATIWDESRMQKTFCGSPYYASPEMVSGTPYAGPEVDIWSMGVILYSMISGGQLPFTDSTLKGLYGRIASGHPAPLPSSSVSISLLDILSRMLCPDPIHRATIEEIATHPWLMGMIPITQLISISSYPITYPLSIPLLTYIALLIPIGDDEKSFTDSGCIRPSPAFITALSRVIELRPDGRAATLYQMLWNRQQLGRLSLPYIIPLDPGIGNRRSNSNGGRKGSNLMKFIAQRLGMTSSASSGINGSQFIYIVPGGSTNTQVTPITTTNFVLLPEEIDPFYHPQSLMTYPYYHHYPHHHHHKISQIYPPIKPRSNRTVIL